MFLSRILNNNYGAQLRGGGSASYLKNTAFNLHATEIKDENKQCLWWDSIAEWHSKKLFLPD